MIFKNNGFNCKQCNAILDSEEFIRSVEIEEQNIAEQLKN